MKNDSVNFQFDAYGASQHLKDRYADFLLDTFRVRAGPLADRLRQHWQGNEGGFSLFRPMLVQGAFPFTPGKTVADLQSPGKEQDSHRPLHPKTVEMLQRANLAPALYEHQVESVLSGSQGKTVVLSAGTGSGKTEAFLIPLIDRLHWAHQRGEDDLSQPGVRAIVVYPLNALVNNQVERLRKLLGAQRGSENLITFAYFTSRLHESYREAKQYYENRKKGEPPKCQIVDRKTLRGLDQPPGRPVGPPHILVTNFSMLEYMLIRPLDRTFFLPNHLFHQGNTSRPRLRAIVLDEAHVYAGAQAAEIHMLLRRTAQRFGTSIDTLQGFATSATLSRGGDEESEKAALAEFATGMFSKSPTQISAIVGRQYLPPLETPLRTASQNLRIVGEPRDLVPPGLRTVDYDDDGSPLKFVEDPQMVKATVDACRTLGIATDEDVASLDEASKRSVAGLLFELMSGHPQLVELRRFLFENRSSQLPTLDEVASTLFGAAGGNEDGRRTTDALLRLASLARQTPGQHPFIPARMHLFLRAPAGVWVSAREASSQLEAEDFSWADVTSMPPSGEAGESPKLQLFNCSSCGAPYFEGWTVRDENGDEVVTATRPGESRAHAVALKCEPSGEFEWPGGKGPRLKRLDVSVRVKAAAGAPSATIERGKVKCERCGDDGATLSPLRLGPRSALGAIVDAVYPYLNQHPKVGSAPLPGGGRRLLTFSDSRQQAARTAAEVESSHDIGVNRRLLVNSLPLGETVGVQELVARIRDRKRELQQRAPARHADDEILEELASVCVYQELARPPARGNTLETLGLVEIVYPKLPPKPRTVPYLTDEEWRDLLSTVLDDVRRRGAVRNLTLSARAKDQYNLHELTPKDLLDKCLVWSTLTPSPALEDEELPTSNEDVIALSPSDALGGAQKHRILRYCGRVVEAVGTGAPSAVQLLREVWDALLDGAKEGRYRWLKTVSKDTYDAALRVDLPYLEVRLHRAPKFIEPESGRVYFRSMRSVPPERGATGWLRELTAEDEERWRHSHPIRRILDERLLGLHSEEHTAQIAVDSLEVQEEDFRAGRLNLLASSTTMEMGIDLGGLTFVILTNAPPGPANYWQRAGRAGRRADGSSAVLTLTQPTPHDQKVFADPRKFLSQAVIPPRVRLDTEPLLLRHANAFLLTAFFEDALEQGARGDPMRAFGSLGEVAFTTARSGRGIRAELADRLLVGAEEPLCDVFLSWLDELGSNKQVSDLLRSLLDNTALAGWTSAEVASACAEAFEQSIRRAQQDMKAIDEQRAEENQKGEGSRDSRYLMSLEHQEKDLKNETTLAYLARTDFLPRFGFPIGLVRLETTYERKESKRAADKRGEHEGISAWPELRMERALDIALSEYVPGAEIIAGKRIHRSAGLIRNWMNADDDGRMKRRFVFECLNCGTVDDRATNLQSCPICATPIQSEEDFRKLEQNANKQEKRKKKQTDDDGLTDSSLSVSSMRSYWMPSSFAVQFGPPPRRVAGMLDRVPSARVRLATSSDEAVREVIPGLLAAGFAPESRLFVRSEGYLRRGGASGFGYAICLVCGRAEPEEGFGAIPNAMSRHFRLRGGGRCPAKPEKHFSRNAVLGTSTSVDALRVRLLGDLNPQGVADEEAFYLTLAICIQQTAAEHLGVDKRTIRSTLGTFKAADGSYGREAVLYDESGSGMLARVAEDAAEVVRRAIEMAMAREEADFIQFDTQFMALQGKLRVDLVRQHFSDKARWRQIQEPESLQHFGARALRGRSPKTAVVSMLQDPNAEMFLFAPQLSTDAFHKSGVLSAVFHSIGNQKAERVRILLGRRPDLSASSDEALLANKLEVLVREGVVVAVARGVDVLPWRALCRRRGAVEAIGGLDAEQETLVPSKGEDFGPDWLVRSIPIELAQGTDGAALWNKWESTWANAEVLDFAALRPRKDDERIRFVPIRHGATDRASTELQALLEPRLGPIPDIGKVQAIGYVDRYVMKSLVAMYRLGQLLELFEYAKGARGFVLSEGTSGQSYPVTKTDDLLGATFVPKSLSDPEAENMRSWIESSSKINGKLKLDFQPQGTANRVYLRHPRKLLVQFAPGGRYKTLKIVFEHGLDWVRPERGSGPWTKRGLVADETHIVVITDHRLEDECDARGDSEWTRYSGK